METNSKSENGNIKQDLLKTVESLIPEEVGFVKAEFEGPDITVYAKNIKPMYEDPKAISSIAEVVKKKIIIRSDAS